MWSSVRAGLLAALTIALVAFLNISLPGRVANIPDAEAAASSCLPPVLRARLAEIRRRFGPVKILSTYRPGARIAGTGRPSFHASCRAVDFHPPSGKYGKVVAFLQANHSGGVGTYSCRMRHIHLDNGPRVRFHKCVR
ncbi:MAG: YcbK family protein [Hyphomicrobiaceae bacterium]